MSERPMVEPAGVSEERLRALIGYARAGVLGFEPRDIATICDELLAARQQLAEMRGLVERVHARSCGSYAESAVCEQLEDVHTMTENWLNAHPLAPTSQPSRGKCVRCGGVKRIEQMPAPKGMKDESSPPTSYWIDCPDCAQPERQVLVIDDAPYNLRHAPPPTDDIVARDPTDFVEFYELMQAYRHAPITDQLATCAAYDAVREYVRSAIAALNIDHHEAARRARIQE